MKKRVRRVAVLASGYGSTLQEIIDAVTGGELSLDIVAVISNKQGVFALRRELIAGIPNHVITASTEKQHDDEMCNILKKSYPDLVVLAGYSRLIGPKVLKNFTVINTHPSLLPKYGGKGMYDMHVHQAVVASKESESGATVHFVNEEYDKGQIIWQTRVPVYPGDTPDDVCKRVQAVEKPQLVSILRDFSEGKIDIPD